MSKSFKIIAFIAVALFACGQGFAQQFTLSGKISDVADAPVIISYTNAEGKSVTDSTIVQNGQFTFKGNINGAALAKLSVSKSSAKFKSGNERNATEVFLEPVTINATGRYDDLKTLVFTGSKSQTEYEVLSKQLNTYYRATDNLETEFLALQGEYNRISKVNNDDPRLKSIDKKTDSLNDIMSAGRNKILNQFITTHPNSYVSAYEIKDWKSYWPFRTVNKYYNSLNSNIQSGQDAKLVKAFIDKIDANSTGKPAKSFTTIDVNGKTISLQDFKGKYVILDFWAHWCVPCRASTPHLMELYNKYHSAGLEVIAVADDDDAQAEWKKAIKKDKMEAWVNILSGYDKDKENQKTTDISNKYSIIVMPTKILIDKSGVIIGRYSGTDEAVAMDKKLAELFN